MKYRRLGDSELEVSVLSMGTWAIGGKDYGPVYDADSRKAIFRAMDLGVNFFDTAPLYGNGHAEEVLGAALEGVRHSVMIATKVGPYEPRPGLLSMNLTPQAMRTQLVDSLRRLRTDYVDLVQIHWWDQGFDLDNAIHGLLALKQEGLAREVGVSNFDVDLMNKVFGIGGVKSLQAPCNMLDCPQGCQLFELCHKNHAGVLAYSPLAKGLLTGKFRGPVRFHEWDVRRRDPAFSGENLRRYLAFIHAVRGVADSIGLNMTQMALAWVIARPGMTSAIFGAKSTTQVAMNVRAGEVVLDSDVLARINAIRKEYLEVSNEGCMD